MIRHLTLLILLAALPLRGQDTTNATPTTAGVAAFRAAYQTWNGAGFEHACKLLQQATVQGPDNVTNCYWLGVAEFHRMLLLLGTPGHAKEADVAQDAAVDALNRALELDPHQAECHALLGTLYGIEISQHWLRVIYLGPRVVSHRDAALAEAPDNPRVGYLLGTCEYYTSSKASGWRKALKIFLAAEEHFAAESAKPPGPLEPRWGRSSCLAFIGLTYEKLNQHDQAAEYFRKALAENPANQLAQTGLERMTGKSQPKDPS